MHSNIPSLITPGSYQSVTDYRSAFCRNENAQLMGPGQRRSFGAGICMLTAVVPWFSDEPKAYPEASALAKAAGVIGKRCSLVPWWIFWKRRLGHYMGLCQQQNGEYSASELFW